MSERVVGDARDEDDRREPGHETGGGVDEEPGAIHRDPAKRAAVSFRPRRRWLVRRW